MEINELKQMVANSEFKTLPTTELMELFKELNNSIANMSAVDVGLTYEAIVLLGSEIERRGQN